jgi:hypothetical protein
MLIAGSLWLALTITSCHFGSTTTTNQDSTAKTPAPLTFGEFLTSLPVVPLPYYLDHLAPIPDNYKVSGFPAIYDCQKAGKLTTVNGYTPVIYSGVMPEGRRVVYLSIYDATGDERSRLQLAGDGYINKESVAYDEHYKDAYLYADFESDSFIVLKCYYQFNDKGNINVEKKSCFFYHITDDGMIAQLPKDTISQEAFAAAFPLKEKPFHEDSVKLNGLKLISRLTPYFNFAEVEVDSVYAYGRIELDGQPAALLFGRKEVEGEGGSAAQVDLITYNEKGNIVGNLMILGGSGIEGGSNKTNNARIDNEGNVRLDEKSTLILEEEAEFSAKVDMQYAIQSSGSIVPVEATLITVTGSVFRQDLLLKQFGSNPIDYLVTEIPSPERLRLSMHFFQKGTERLMELFTSNADGMVLDRYPVYTTLKKVSYKEAASKDQEAEGGYVVEKRGHYTKDVVIKLPGKDVHIDADGRFVK